MSSGYQVAATHAEASPSEPTSESVAIAQTAQIEADETEPVSLDDHLAKQTAASETSHQAEEPTTSPSSTLQATTSESTKADAQTPAVGDGVGSAEQPAVSDEVPLSPASPSRLPPSMSIPEIKAALASERDQAKAAAAAASGGTSSTAESSAATDDNVILGIAVVDFNHLVGPQIEYTYPKQLQEDEDLVRSLPFLALPDGSHLSDEDFCYFHLHCPKLSDSTIFGISCNRQIAANALLRKGAEVTRSTVQKAIVVLAKEPIFGPIREKLGIVTRAFFAQGDLADVDILIDFHSTLEIGLQSGGMSEDRETVMYMGTSLRELVHKWRFKTLMLVKLLLLQRRIMFFGYPVEQLCNYQYSLVSLIPGLLLSLQDAGDPKLQTRSSRVEVADSLRSSDRKSLLKFLGMPLDIFGEDAFFQPYCPLQQIDLLKSRTWLVGTSNSIFKQQRDCKIDVIVDLENAHLDFQDPKLHQAVNLTPEDRKWMDEVISSVVDTWNPADPTRPTSMGFHGSDDYLRIRFEDYICAMLSSTKYADFLAKSDAEQVAIQAPDASTTSSFGAEFLAALRGTEAFALWNSVTDPMLFDIVDHKHPCEGKTSAIEDVGLRLSAGLHDLRLEENLAPTREAIGSALQAGSANIYRLATNFRQDIAKFRANHAAASQNSAGEGAGTGPGGLGAITSGFGFFGSGDKAASSGQVASTSTGAARASGSITGEAIDADGQHTTRSGRIAPAEGQGAGPGFNANEALNAAGQAAAQAGTQMRAALGNFGSFLSARQKSWAASRANSSTNPSANNSQPQP
ncbi:cytoplasm protein [Moesziomyces antarcticus]|uniref:Related to AVL9 - protein involved in exocytic transport from the Golgi n=2 Tax=Pseudozyma antarctica TaxID=84753 RepID=A0A5C3FU45_PSEA2|nr:cytoplasm protein [Moesziomyces antarcticus]GAK66111.1 cytoplasm protein [Moesziomyces antarcticus]SPO46889.1 related to AVL9 - protein involved in exocytic transport from the Golgi [Moesziomyces antarcticus]